MKTAVLLSVLFLGTAPLTATPPAQTSGEIGLGQKLRLGPIQVRPLTVVEDSRCPKSVKCDRPNRIVVRTEVRGPRSTKTRDFEIGFTREVEGAGGVMLAAVSPTPPVDATIAPTDYRFTYMLSR